MSSNLSAAVAAIANLQAQSKQDLNRYLAERLQVLVEHTGEQNAFYRTRLRAAGWRPGQALSPEVWANIEPLQRTELQERGHELLCPNLPDDCGDTAWVSSSGSTGRPIRVMGTRQQAGLWQAITVREHIEQQRDLTGRLAVIKVTQNDQGQPPEGTNSPDWGAPINGLYRTGPSAVLSIDADTDTQARWLNSYNPHYLLTYPSNLDALIECVSAGSLSLPALHQARTFGELVEADLRERCSQHLGVDLIDVYSSAEVGYIAIQVPGAAHYRCRNESVLIELLNDKGTPCQPGEIGRVVVTALYSFAMPLLRYEIGDHAIGLDSDLFGGAPQHLQHIIGRTRNLLRLPDGSKRWPRLGLRRMTDIAPLRQVQTIQSALHRLDLKVVCAVPLSTVQRDELVAHLKRRFSSIEEVNIEEVESIARAPGHKFEEFRCTI